MTDSQTYPPQETFETILPRLGDYLLKEGLITAESLQQALDYQKELRAAGKMILLGQALLVLGLIDGNLLDQAIKRQILDLHTALQASNRELEDRVQQRTADLQRRLLQIRTAAEITQFAISAVSLNDLFKRTVNLIVERFGYYSASIFMLDESRKNVFLVETAGPFSASVKQRGEVIPIGSRSMVGWVAANNQARVSADVRQEFFYHIDDLLTETRSEACLPISAIDIDDTASLIGLEPQAEEDKTLAVVFGVLDIQHNLADAFDPDVLAVLQTIANHIASVVQNIRLLEVARQKLKETATLFNASHRLSQAKNVIDVLSAAGRTLEEAPFPAVLLVVQGNEFKPFLLGPGKLAARMMNKPEGTGEYSDPQTNPNLTRAQGEALFPSGAGLVVVDLSQPSTYPQPILTLARQMGSTGIGMIPVRDTYNLAAIFILGVQPTQPPAADASEGGKGGSLFLSSHNLDISTIQSYTNLAQLTSTALERVGAFETVERRMRALQALNAISQLVTTRTNLNELYSQIHAEINRFIGNVDFIIALYDSQTDTIQIPYMVEIDSGGGDPQAIEVPSFPLGQGLTSIIINTRQPLMLNYDTENKARQLGAIVLGQPAKSWLGVPLLIYGEPIGAIIVQDRELEGRFKKDDLSLLNTLAAQVAVSIRNARLLENATRQAERERKLYEITSKIRNATDMQAIIRTTAVELRKAMKVQRARIDIDVDTALHSSSLDSHQLDKDPL